MSRHRRVRPWGKRTHRKRWADAVTDRVRDKTLSSHAGHVAYVLMVHYVPRRDEARPTPAELAASTALSERAIMGALLELERHGLLDVRCGPTRRSRDVYRLRIPATLEELAA